MGIECFDIDAADNAFWIANNMEEKRYEYNANASHTILDIGAYQGEWSQKMHDRYGCFSIMFEPVDILGEFRAYEWASVHPAAWIHNGRLSFGGNGYWTSHFINGTQEYPCVDILGYLSRLIEVCKINIEGGEYELMHHILDSGLQRNINNFQIQFHRIDNYMKLYYAITKKLMETHTKTWGLNFVWENWVKRSDV